MIWVGSSRKDLRGFPPVIRRGFGLALFAAQMGVTPPDAKPLKGFGGASVLELVESEPGGTYRAVYTVRFATAIYVLHAFQKKSKRGIMTPKPEIDLIRRRLRQAEDMHIAKSKDA